MPRRIYEVETNKAIDLSSIQMYEEIGGMIRVKTPSGTMDLTSDQFDDMKSEIQNPKFPPIVIIVFLILVGVIATIALPETVETIISLF